MSTALTYEEAQQMIRARFTEFPELGAIANDPNLRTELSKILAFSNAPDDLLPYVAHELILVLALYIPIDDLAENITESTGLPIDVSESIVTLIESVILTDLSDDLHAYSLYWKAETEKENAIPTADPTLKERLDLRPSDMGVPRTGTVQGNTTGEEMARPLTREELLSALSAKRTMASDIAAVQQQGDVPVQGYEAYLAEKSGEQKE